MHTDDTGGFFDHVIPPHEGVPADEAPCGEQNHGCPSEFDFRRLGNRVASFIMSPWVAKGGVIQTPKVLQSYARAIEHTDS